MDSFYADSFWDLSSTRKFERGPVPWDTIVEYGHHKGLASDMIDTFVVFIRAMDTAFLEWATVEAGKNTD